MTVQISWFRPKRGYWRLLLWIIHCGFVLVGLGAWGSLLGCFAVSTALAFYQEQYLTTYRLLFQTQLPTTSLVWFFGRAVPRNQPDEGIYEINSLREGGFDPQWVLLGMAGREWKKVSGCCCKPDPVFMEAEQEERRSDPDVWQATARH